MKRISALLLAGLLGIGIAHAQDAAAPAAPADQQQAQPRIKPGDDYITLNFSNIDIAALVKVMSEYTRKNFILDDKVAGKLTLMTPTKISAAEAYQVFLSALEIKGYTAIEDGKIIRIVPMITAKQGGLPVISEGNVPAEGFVTKLLRLSYVNPQDIVKTLQPLITKDGSMLAYPATNSLIITDTVQTIRKIEQLVNAMDVPAPSGKGKINVYYLKNANAEDIAKVMQALVSRLPVPPTGGGPRGGMAEAGPATILEGAVTITADKMTNSLIIIASPIDFETMKDVIQKLDIRRRQVYVEAAIIEMGLAKQRELGFEFNYVPQAIQSGAGAPTTPFGGTNFGNIGNVVTNGPAGLGAMNGLTVGAIKGTFSYKGTEFLNIGALLHALQTDGDVNVLSTPNILTTDNQKAEIMVGENVPFITGQTQNAATSGGAILTSINRQDVGIKLQITPQITSDDNVRLEVKQEISDITVTPGLNPNIVGPSMSKRSADTTVVIKDRQTMVIGGLIRDNLISTTSKVPLLGDIPILGWLFKYKTTRMEKTNLMIFITPYIIKNEQDAGAVTKLKNDSLENFRKEYRLEKKDVGPTAVTQEKSAAAKPAKEAQQPAAVVTTAPTTTSSMQPAPGVITESTGTAPMQQVPAVTTAPTPTASMQQTPAVTSAPTATESVPSGTQSGSKPAPAAEAPR